jgi:hypothetical protein
LERGIFEADAGPTGDVTRPVQFDKRAEHRPEHDQSVGDTRQQSNVITPFRSQRLQ